VSGSPGEQPVYRNYPGRDLGDAQQRAAAEQRDAWASGYVSTGQYWDEAARVLTVRYERAKRDAPPSPPPSPSSPPERYGPPPGYGPQGGYGPPPGYGPPHGYGPRPGYLPPHQRAEVPTWRVVLAILLFVALGAGAVAVQLTDGQVAPLPPTVIKSGADTGAVPRIEGAECLGPHFGLFKPTCGFLVVPEDRAAPNGTRIRIHYAVYPAVGSSPEPDPVVYLDGGPGGSPLSDGFLFRPFVDRRDLIVLDQRGTGFSRPTLDCPEVDKLDLDVTTFARSAAIQQCRDRILGEGVDLSRYTTRESASDVEDLRVALGYPAWNLYGVSYGTRLALAVMRDHASGVRSAILDSVYPPQIDAYGAQARNAQRAFTLLFQTCAQQPACAARAPHLEQTFFDGVTTFDRPGTHVKVPRPGLADPTDVELNGDMLIEYLFEKLYDSEAIPGLPASLEDIQAGDVDDLIKFLSQASVFRRPVPPSTVGLWDAGSGTISEGMQLSVQCAEEVPYSAGDPVDVVDAHTRRLVQSFSSRALRNACEIWNVPRSEPYVREPVSSEIPTLLLAGEFDPITPPEWADAADATLARGQVLTFPAVGHGVVGTTMCADGIVAGFLLEPTARADTRCIASLPGIVFKH
jgi:pimeloyl-ACP methyl ester carboxylesterase